MLLANWWTALVGQGAEQCSSPAPTSGIALDEQSWGSWLRSFTAWCLAMASTISRRAAVFSPVSIALRVISSPRERTTGLLVPSASNVFLVIPNGCAYRFSRNEPPSTALYVHRRQLQRHLPHFGEVHPATPSTVVQFFHATPSRRLQPHYPSGSPVTPLPNTML